MGLSPFLNSACSGGISFSLPPRGRGTAAAVEEGRYGREWRVIPTAPAHYAPPQSGLRPASSTFYGIAATGSYARLDSLRDAPPGGEAFGAQNPRVRMASRGKRAQSYACCSAASISARYFLTLTSLTTQVKTFMAMARSSQLGKEGAMRMLLSWGSLP